MWVGVYFEAMWIKEDGKSGPKWQHRQTMANTAVYEDLGRSSERSKEEQPGKP